MKEVKGDIWDYHKQGKYIVIPTNGTVKINGEAVMGRGLALQAKLKFPCIPRTIGKYLGILGTVPIVFQDIKVLTFPVKYNWFEKADVTLIEESCKHLVYMWYHCKEEVYLPRVGCGNGRLDWKDVKPILEKYLDDRFIIVNNEEEVKPGLRRIF